MTQFALPLAWTRDAGDRDFIVTDANRAAVRHLDHPALWPHMATLLTGPHRSGRTLLGRLFAERRGATVIDDADAADEEALFHAWNAAQTDRRALLLVTAAAPPDWVIALPDLRSRIAATPIAAIGDPDEALSEALLARQLGKRGLATGPELLRWLVARLPRSYAAIDQAVDLLDTASLSAGRRLTIPFAREALATVIDLSSEHR